MWIIITLKQSIMGLRSFIVQYNKTIIFFNLGQADIMPVKFKSDG